MRDSPTRGTDSGPRPHAPGPILPGEVVARFEREATRGVCDTGRYRMPYYTWGQGPPLVFIHGAADTAMSFRLVIARLSAHFRCIAYTLPQGHGDGSRLWSYRHADLVEDLWAALRPIPGPIAPFVLRLVRFGSTIALTAMRQHPERIPRAILQGGTAYRPLRFLERVLTFGLRFFPGKMAKLRQRRALASPRPSAVLRGLPEESTARSSSGPAKPGWRRWATRRACCTAWTCGPTCPRSANRS